MKNIRWDDLQLFLHVAETNGLSGAARRTGMSAATVGRRMLALEQQTGQALFVRAQTGYTLTAMGEALRIKVRAMEAASVPIDDLLSAQAQTPVLRLSAGTGTALFLADRFAALNRPGDPFRLNFITTEAVLDIAHREVELGIRNKPAQGGNLASRRLATLRFAPYRSWAAPSPETLDWVAMDPANARHRAARWIHKEGHTVRVMANSISTVHQLVKAGAGIGVMPCMVADNDPTLARAGPVIEELTEDQHLVMHNEDRHRTPMRRLIERIVAVYNDNADLLAGQRPLRSNGLQDG